MKHSTTLHQLPAAIVFPEHLRARIEFEPELHKLSYDGFMTKCTYDELIALSTDAPYRRAVEQLFVQSAGEVAPPKSRRLILLTLAASAAGLIVIAALVGWAVVRETVRGDAQAVDSDPIDSRGE